VSDVSHHTEFSSVMSMQTGASMLFAVINFPVLLDVLIEEGCDIDMPCNPVVRVLSSVMQRILQ
jgi:hypothetical protein